MSTEHIVKSFEDELDALSTAIAQMGGLTEVQLSGAIDSVARKDLRLAEQTVASDAQIDAMEHEIEAQAV